jgi:hypothetical protein
MRDDALTASRPVRLEGIMKAESSLNDVFRFVCLRPPSLPTDPVTLKATQFAAAIGQAGQPPLRREAGDRYLRPGGESVRAVSGVQLGITMDPVLAGLSEDATAGAFAARFGDIAALVATPGFRLDIQRLSDTLLAAMFAGSGIPPQLGRLEALFHGYVLLEMVAADPGAADLIVRPFLRRPLLLPFPNDWFVPAGGRAVVRAVGMADLLVVRRQIKRYEATEIAYVENIMSGETRSRDHRFLSRIEDTLSVENETTKERSEELETTERFELNRETARTIQEDQKFGFSLSVSATFGSTMEVQTGLNAELSRSSETTAQDSSAYAQEIVARSLERIEERVRTERISKLLRETEENNRHAFVNGAGEHVAGIYQFLDKIYEAQVFNYGNRLMFDLMVPEPASFLWHLESVPDNASEVKLPAAPMVYDLKPIDLLYADGDLGRAHHYMAVATRYGAAGIDVPPPERQVVTLTLKEPTADGTAGNEADQARTVRVLDIPLPDGYVPTAATLVATALSDTGSVRLYVTIGDRTLDLSGDTEDIGFGRVLRRDNVADPIDLRHVALTGPSALKLTLVTWETANYALTVNVECIVSPDHVRKWQMATHDLIRAAYQNRLLEYNDQVARLNAEARATRAAGTNGFGFPPGKRLQIMLTELKKHALTIFTDEALYERDFSSRVDSPAPNDVPRFDPAKAAANGSFIRFMEQAFEWNHMQYAFYPYFWGARSDWPSRFRKEDPDYEFEQFLQAGAARVVVPVRPGFAEAVGHYLETRELWLGDDKPPSIGSALYVSIVDELKERTGGDGLPSRVGKPWEIRLPTSLVLLRRAAGLPAWQETPPDSWEWTPVEG